MSVTVGIMTAMFFTVLALVAYGWILMEREKD